MGRDWQIQVAGEIITDQAANGECKEDELIIEWKAHPVQHLANDHNRDGSGCAHDRPAPGHQFEAAVRTGDVIHHHAEQDGYDGLRECRKRPDTQDDKNEILPGDNKWGDSGKRIGENHQQPCSSKPGHDVGFTLQVAADHHRQQQSGECRHGGQQADLEVGWLPGGQGIPAGMVRRHSPARSLSHQFGQRENSSG